MKTAELVRVVGLSAEVTDAIIAVLETEGVNTVEEVALFNDSELSKMLKEASILGLNTVGIKKVIATLRNGVKDAAEPVISLPELPTQFNDKIELVISGNLEVPMQSILELTRVSILNRLGIEEIGRAVANLVTLRLNQLDKAATEEQMQIYVTAEKFRKIDDTIYTSLLTRLNIQAALVNSRQGVIDSGNNVFLPNLVKYLNNALDFRHQITSVDNYMLQKMFGQKSIGVDVDKQSLIAATQEFVIDTNKVLRGLNTLVIRETYSLYVELFNLINDKKLLDFVGATDVADLFRAIGINISPRDLKLYEQLPAAIYSLLSVATADGKEFDNPQVLYAYLQKVWSVFTTLNISGLAEKRSVAATALLVE